MSSEHAVVPEAVRKQYQQAPELADYLDALAADSTLVFEDWQTAYAMALDMMIDADNLNMFPAQHYGAVSSDMASLLEFLNGKLLWASTIRTKSGVEISPDHELRNSKHVGKFEDPNFLTLYKMSTRNQTRPNPQRQYVHSDFLAMLMTDDINERLNNYVSLKTLDSIMNCEEFLALCLLSLKLVSFKDIQKIIQTCAGKNSYELLHQAFNLGSAVPIDQIDTADLKDFKILFEMNRLGQVAHVALLSPNRHVYELGFGTSEEEFRVLKTDVNIFMESSKRRDKQLLASSFDPKAVQFVCEAATDMNKEQHPNMSP